MNAVESASDGLPKVSNRRSDSFFGWDQLVLLLTPFPVIFVARLAYVLGLDNDGVDRIAALYVTPVFFVSIGTFLVGPAIAAVGLIWLLGRNIYLRRFKRLVAFAVVLIVLPLGMRLVDADYLRFMLQERSLTESLKINSEPMPPRSARCTVFDRIQDNFYFGGANFLPYTKLVVYVSEDLAGEISPDIQTFLPGGYCPLPQDVDNIRHLKGRFFLAVSTFRG